MQIKVFHSQHTKIDQQPLVIGNRALISYAKLYQLYQRMPVMLDISNENVKDPMHSDRMNVSWGRF